MRDGAPRAVQSVRNPRCCNAHAATSPRCRADYKRPAEAKAAASQDAAKAVPRDKMALPASILEAAADLSDVASLKAFVKTCLGTPLGGKGAVTAALTLHDLEEVILNGTMASIPSVAAGSSAAPGSAAAAEAVSVFRGIAEKQPPAYVFQCGRLLDMTSRLALSKVSKGQVSD